MKHLISVSIKPAAAQPAFSIETLFLPEAFRKSLLKHLPDIPRLWVVGQFDCGRVGRVFSGRLLLECPNETDQSTSRLGHDFRAGREAMSTEREDDGRQIGGSENRPRG
jgi:hypothetical protein